MFDCKECFLACFSFYYVANCLLFTSSYISEEYMDNDCIGFLKKKFRNYQNVPQNDEIE